MDAVLDEAVLVFRERGFHATSLNDLIAATKLANGSLYKAFGDKRAVFLAAFDRYTERRSARVKQLLGREQSGLDKIRALVGFYADSAYGVEGRLGCLVVGSATDLATFDTDVARRVTTALQHLKALLHELIMLGQSDGSVASEVEPKACAHALLCLLQGLRVAGKIGQTRLEAVALVDQAMRLLA